MLQSLITLLFKRRHFWRYATFSEVAELYASRLIRILALNMISLFVAVYLFRSGYTLQFIAIYLSIYYLCKVGMSFFGSWYIARFGPKHAILIANLLYIPALVLFMFVPEAGAPHALQVIIGFGFFQGLSATVYDYAHLVTFSKVKSLKHAGKEIGFMNIIEKIAGIVSPLLGGLVATFLGPEVVMMIAAGLFAIAAIPLFRTAEPTRLGQKVSFAGFPWKTTIRPIVAESAIGLDVAVTGAIWSLFLAAVVFAGQDDSIYITIGSLVALGTLAAFVSAYVFGHLIDKNSGKYLLRWATIGKSISHLLRPFTANPVMAGMINMGSEVSTSGYSMAFMRGAFDTADRSGHRITFFLLVEIAVNVGAAFACGVLALSLWFFEPQIAFTIVFVFGAAYLSLLHTAGFQIYKK